ncbi:thiamine diphosphokinase [Fusobacterium sp. PH5-44]|uniref:thiamine diphosphokinase n=1 Tax=unclassified Fusobacterium TaxID=2648384 RepID=UPI003D210A4A
MKRAYVFLNGELKGKESFYKGILNKQKGDVYCADGGASHLEKINVLPNELWGDLDSISEDLLSKYQKNNVKVVKFPKDKDKTDGELLINHLSNLNYDEIIVIGGLGGRTDHFLSNINWLFMYEKLYFITETETIFKVHSGQAFGKYVNCTVSFVPYSRVVENVSLTGFKYALSNYTIKIGDSICMSNIVISKESSIKISKGDLICIINK